MLHDPGMPAECPIPTRWDSRRFKNWTACGANAPRDRRPASWQRVGDVECQVRVDQRLNRCDSRWLKAAIKKERLESCRLATSLSATSLRSSTIVFRRSSTPSTGRRSVQAVSARATVDQWPVFECLPAGTGLELTWVESLGTSTEMRIAPHQAGTRPGASLLGRRDAGGKHHRW